MSTSFASKQERRLLRLTMQRAGKRNALNVAACEEFLRLLTAAEADDTVGAVLLDTEGDVFCSGMDLEEVLSVSPEELNRAHEALFTIGLRAKKPLIAAVQGGAYGGGVGLIANAHVVIAAEGCQFGLTEIRLGMWPYVVFRAVAAAVGERRAVELSLTARVFSVQEACQWGLVHQVTPPGDLAAHALDVAEKVSQSSLEAIGGGLHFVQESRGRSSSEAGKLAAAYREIALRSPDFREGVTAFREKRKPHWPSLPHDTHPA